MSSISGTDMETSQVCEQAFCKEKVVSQLELQPPYNLFQLEIFDEMNKSSDWFNGFVDKLDKKNYSNSDVSRLMKQAKSISGQRAIQNNFFVRVGKYNELKRDDKLKKESESQTQNGGSNNSPVTKDKTYDDSGDIFVSTLTTLKQMSPKIESMFTTEHLEQLEEGKS